MVVLEQADNVFVNQEGLKLNGTLQFMVYSGGAIYCATNMHTIKKNTHLVRSQEEGFSRANI